MRYRIPICLALLAAVLPRPAASASDIDRLISLTDSLTNAVKLDSAIVTGRLALEGAETRFGKVDSTVALVLVKLGIAYFYKAQLGECETVWNRALEIRRQVFGENHPTTANSLVYVGVLHDHQGFSETAVSILEPAWEIFENATTYVAGQKGDCAHNLGIAYTHVGNYEKAEELLGKAMTIYTASKGPDSDSVGGCLANLGLVSHETGDYAGALDRFERALAILEASQGPNHPDVALTLENIANSSVELGQHEKAATNYLRALEIKRATLGPRHPEVASTLANLGNLYFATERFDQAEPALAEALSILERTAPNGLEVARVYANLAKVYVRSGKNAQAESYFLKTLDIREDILTPFHPSVAVALSNLGILYMEQERYAEALECYLRALKIDETMLGTSHPTVADIIENTATVCRLQAKPDSALALYARACAIHQKNLIDNGRALSEADALIYSAELRAAISRYASAWLSFPDVPEGSADELARAILRGKGQVSDVMFERQRAVVSEGDPDTRALAASLQQHRQELADAFVRGPGAEVGDYRRRVRTLTAKIEEEESALATKSGSFKKWQQGNDISADRIRERLPSGAAVVEYLYYEHAMVNPSRIVPSYAVLIIRPDASPVIVALGDAREIDDLIGEYRQHFRNIAAFGSPGAGDVEAYRSIAGALYERLWRPIQEFVASDRLILVCPDGALALVSFAGLPVPGGHYLIEQVAIHYLSSARDLIRFGDRSRDGAGLLALGDPDYGATNTPADPASTTRSVSRGDLPDCDDFWKTVVSPLPGTRREVEQIVHTWLQTETESSTVLLGGDATEAAFKASAAGKRAIHLATHGYYLGASCRREPVSAGGQASVSNPLLLSGLFLSGANERGHANQADADDGVLTAFEVTGIDLGGCALVVLSACETGLGEPEVGEGVYGLRRAFHMAGARTVVSVLWEVADSDAARFAGQLYENSASPLPDRMRALQLGLIRTLRANDQPDHPFSWAAFVAQGEWRN